MFEKLTAYIPYHFYLNIKISFFMLIKLELLSYKSINFQAKSKMSSTGGNASAVAKQQSNNSSPDLVRHNCDVTKEEEITLLGLKKS